MTEICFNLWYYLSEQQTITRLAARAYMLDGDEDDKAKLLMALSEHDYKIVPQSPLPRGLCQTGRIGVHYSALQTLGIERVFHDLFQGIRRSIPDTVPFPEDKLFYATPLYDFGNGFVPARVGDGFIVER